MKRSLSVVIMLSLVALLSCCIISTTPKDNPAIVLRGETKTFTIQVFPSPNQFVWTLDNEVVSGATGPSVDYTPATIGEVSHVLVVQAGKNTYTWNIKDADVKQEIGSSGGTIESPDGNVKLDVPANSLDNNTVVGIANTGTMGDISPIYAINATDKTIQEPVKVTLSYDPASLPSYATEDELYIVTWNGDGYEEKLLDIMVDKENHTISGLTRHFSDQTIVAPIPTVVNIGDLPITRDFRMPIGDSGSQDLGDDIDHLLTIGSFQDEKDLQKRSNYPKIRFNYEGASDNKWAVSVAFNKNTWLFNGPEDGRNKIYAFGKMLDDEINDYHPGEDWNSTDGNDLGKPLHAIATGRVVYNANQSDFGNILVLGHRISDEEVVFSVYAHLQSHPDLAVGTEVNKGVQIGNIGIGGTAAHLHFEIAKKSCVTIDSNGVIKINKWNWVQYPDVIEKNYYHPSNFIKNIAGQTDWEFRVNDNTEGWEAPKDKIESYSVKKTKSDDGILTLDPAATDPQIVSSPLKVKTSEYNAIEISMSSKASNTAGAIYFKTLADDKYTEDKQINFTVNNDGNFYKYPPLNAVYPTKWSGTITGLRLDPIHDGVSGSNADEVKIDYIKFVTTIPTYTVTGRVVYQGSGLSGVTVNLQGINSTTTNNSGTYTFTNVANGSYTLTFSKVGYTFNPVSVLITVSNANYMVYDVIATQEEDPISVLLSSLVSIPGGTFMMGSTESLREMPVHAVTLQKFEIGAYEVTQAQFAAIMGYNPSYFSGPGSENNPVEFVWWYEAREFCTRLSALAGRTFTLPSEAQWEYACRAGSTTRYSFGDDDGLLGNYAWYKANSNDTTHPVGRKLPNAWGLYDMYGNVYEWCLDSWHSNYIGAPTDGSAWDPETGLHRVLRGGEWRTPLWGCRSASRSAYDVEWRLPPLGFRVVAIP